MVDLVQLVKRPLEDSSTLLQIKEGRLAFGEAEDHYSTDSKLVGWNICANSHSFVKCWGICPTQCYDK